MDYLADQLSLEDFLDKIMDQAEEVDGVGDPGLNDLVNTIKLYWAELTGDFLTRQEFRDLLRPFVELITVPLHGGDVEQQQIITTSTTAETSVIDDKPETLLPLSIAPDVAQSSSSSLVENGPLVDNPQRNTSQVLVLQ